MTECKRHKADKRVDPDWKPVSNAQKTVWAIAVIYRCVRCSDHMSPRIANHTIKPTQREAMLAYGIPQADVDIFFPPADPVEAPLGSWPFPVSAHVDKKGPRRRSPGPNQGLLCPKENPT